MQIYLKTGVIALFLILILIGLVIFYYCRDLPSIEKLEWQESRKIIHINYDNSARLINRSNVSENKIDFFQIPNHLLRAVLLTEDRRFFFHHGIDLVGIIRAYTVNYKAGKIVQGGSTITQQLAKMLFLKSQKTLKRKIQEAILALQLEQYFTKEQILTFYLNRAYFGSGSYGIEEASRKYFNKKVSEINRQESALLAGILKAPSKISPKNNLKLAQERANLILKIVENNYNQIVINSSWIDGIKDYSRLYFSDFIIQNYQKFIDKERQFTDKEITINSTLNQQIQAQLEDIINVFYKKNNKKIAKKNIAVVILNKDGALQAMIGGNNYRQDQFNHAMDLKETGTFFNNFIYLEKYSNDQKNGDYIKKKNSNKISSPKLITDSKKNLAKQDYQQINENKMAIILKKFDLEKEIMINKNNIAKPIIGSSLLDLSGFFATIANDGFVTKPYFINNIKDKKGDVLYQYDKQILQKKIKNQELSKIKKILQKAGENGDLKIHNYNQDIISLSGSSIDNKNNWLIGFDNEKIIGIWFENSDKNSQNNLLNFNIFDQLFAQISRNISL